MLGRLTEETPDWEELESKEAELTDREGPVGGAGLVEETLSGTSGSVERETRSLLRNTTVSVTAGLRTHRCVVIRDVSPEEAESRAPLCEAEEEPDRVQER